MAFPDNSQSQSTCTCQGEPLGGAIRAAAGRAIGGTSKGANSLLEEIDSAIHSLEEARRRIAGGY